MNIRKILAGSMLTAALLVPAAAMAAPASEASIKQLLAVTQAQKLLESMHGRLDALMNNAIQQQLKGKTPNAKQQQAIDHLTTKIAGIMHGMLSWEKMEPMYLRIYQQAFTEDEVDGMLAFYKTPAGQAVINKMPVLMQQTMMEMQKTLAEATPQMMKAQQEFAAEFKAASQ